MIYGIVIGTVLLALWLARGGSSGRGIRRIEEDFEAKLRPVDVSGPARAAWGKAEREREHNGNEEFELRCTGIETGRGTGSVSAGAVLEIVLDGAVIGTAPITGTAVRFELRSERGETVPVVREGSVVAVRYEGTVLLEGVFARD